MSRLPKMPFPGHHGHHSGLPDNLLPFLRTLSCLTKRPVGGRSSRCVARTHGYELAGKCDLGHGRVHHSRLHLLLQQGSAVRQHGSSPAHQPGLCLLYHCSGL